MAIGSWRSKESATCSWVATSQLWMIFPSLWQCQAAYYVELFTRQYYLANVTRSLQARALKPSGEIHCTSYSSLAILCFFARKNFLIGILLWLYTSLHMHCSIFFLYGNKNLKNNGTYTENEITLFTKIGILCLFSGKFEKMMCFWYNSPNVHVSFKKTWYMHTISHNILTIKTNRSITVHTLKSRSCTCKNIWF